MERVMKYIKKPISIEAIQWTGDNFMDILSLSSDGGRDISEAFVGDFLTIKTLEGDMRADLNDYIIKGFYGECYPCKPDIFKATYYTEQEWAQEQEQ